MILTATQLDSKFKCLFTASATVTENKWSKYKKKTNKKKKKMAANLPELYKKNAGQTGERDVLYTALMPLKSEFTKKTPRHLNHTCTTAIHNVYEK